MIWEIWNQYKNLKLPQDLTGRGPDWRRPLSTNLLGQFLPIWLQCEGENVPKSSSSKVFIGYFHHLWNNSHNILSLWRPPSQSLSFRRTCNSPSQKQTNPTFFSKCCWKTTTHKWVSQCTLWRKDQKQVGNWLRWSIKTESLNFWACWFFSSFYFCFLN